jgi:hypothetical protein
MLPKDDNSDVAKKVKEMPSHGRTDPTLFTVGWVLSALGYALLIVGTLV